MNCEMTTRFEAFMAGQKQGAAGCILDPQHIRRDLLATYTLGWSVGLDYWRKDSPLVEKPDWMTVEQFGAIIAIYFRSSTIGNFVRMFNSVENYGDYCGLAWAGMFLGIEKDGYTHS